MSFLVSSINNFDLPNLIKEQEVNIDNYTENIDIKKKRNE